MGHALNYCILNNRMLFGGNSLAWNNRNQWSPGYSLQSLGGIRKNGEKDISHRFNHDSWCYDLTIASIVFLGKPFKKHTHTLRTIKEVVMSWRWQIHSYQMIFSKLCNLGLLNMAFTAENEVSSIIHRFKKHYVTNNLGKNKVCAFCKRLMITKLLWC